MKRSRVIYQREWIRNKRAKERARLEDEKLRSIFSINVEDGDTYDDTAHASEEIEETFSEAMLKCSLAEETSNLEDELEDEGRKRKRPRRYMSTDEDVTTTNENSPFHDLTSDENFQSEPSVTDSILASSTPLHFSTQNPITEQPTVMLKLDEMSKQMVDVFDIVKDFSQRLENLTKKKSTVEEDSDPITLFKTPMEEVAEVECLEEELQQTEKYKALFRYFRKLQGNRVGDTVRRILRNCGTNQLWSYSFKGRKGKLPFCILRINKAISHACLKLHSAARVKDVEFELSEALKHAPHKRGGTKYKTNSSAIQSSSSDTFPLISSDSDDDDA
ncbi:uncharacterized protein LOC144747036 [Ciona intestinalis]